jgi:hypothetical protein
MLPHEPLDVVPLAPPARVTDNGEDRRADIGQSECAIAGHRGEYGRTKRELKAPSASSTPLLDSLFNERTYVALSVRVEHAQRA